jgi:hypothetical protein
MPIRATGMGLPPFFVPHPVHASLLAVALLVSGCATVQAETGGSGTAGTGLPPGVSAQELEAAAEAEAALLATQLWEVTRDVHEEGARLSFTFWNQHGALSLTGFSAHGRSGPPGAAVDAEQTQRALSAVLSQYPRRHLGGATLTLRREQAGWAVDYSGSHAPRPPEARTLPVPLREFPADTVLVGIESLRRLLSALEVPAGGEASVEVKADLEDGRIEGWRLHTFQLTRSGGRPRALSPHVTHQAVQVLLPFTLGLGPRTVHLRMKLAHHPQDTAVHGWVESAEVERPPPPPETIAQATAEYHAMHEFILWRWRHEVKEGGKWAAQRGAEELVLWYAGGVLLKGGGFLVKWGESAMRRALARGGEASAGWLRTALSRLPGDKRREFEQLWAKVHVEGERALTADERAKLRGLMERIELLVKTRLEPSEKNLLRRHARERYKKLHPELEKLLDEAGPAYPIHHRRPLDYASLFPDEDINAAHHLAMVRKVVHDHINRAWDRFRRLRPEPRADEVLKAAEAIDATFGDWYHRVGNPPVVKMSLAEAEQAALRALEQLFPR